MDDYVTIAEAAELENIDYETLKKRIQRNSDKFLTKKEKTDDGGKDRVLVAVSSLSRKAQSSKKLEIKIEETIEDVPWYVDVDINWYIENNKERYYKAVELANTVRKFVEYDIDNKTEHAEEVARKLDISTRSLYRFAQAYSEANAWAVKMEKEDGRSYDYFKVLSLCRKPKLMYTFPSLSDEMRALIENIWFDRTFASNLGTIEMLYEKFEEVAEERGWESYPSIKTVARYIKYIMDELRGKNAHFLQANGMREFKNKMMIKGKRDATALKVMEFVQGDEHTFDCWVQYTAPNGKIKAVRPKLVAWIDTRSRCIMGDVICLDANTQILKESLVKMIYSPIGGVPKHLHIDNGKDYTSKENLGKNRKERRMLEFDAETKGFYRSIGIEEWSRSLPYQPWGKAQVERFFGTVCSRFTKWMASYTGTLTGSKTAAKRQKDVKTMLEHGELLTMEEFFEMWTKWKEEKYHNKEHGGLKKDREQYIKPAELFNNAEKYMKPAPPREYAATLLMKSDKARVRNQGIIKFGTIYTDYELSKYVNETVGIKWDMDNVTKLYVYDKHGKKICEAVSHELLKFAPKITQEELVSHLRNQKRQLRDTKEDVDYYNTPYEKRAENATPLVVGGIDIGIKKKQKVISIPQDKEYKQNAVKPKKLEKTFLDKKAEEALEKLKALG